jgi:hypothetical protein
MIELKVLINLCLIIYLQITYEPNPQYILNNNSINVNNRGISPSSNFYRRFPTPNTFNQSKSSFINKMMFNSWNNN